MLLVSPQYYTLSSNTPTLSYILKSRDQSDEYITTIPVKVVLAAICLYIKSLSNCSYLTGSQTIFFGFAHAWFTVPRLKILVRFGRNHFLLPVHNVFLSIFNCRHDPRFSRCRRWPREHRHLRHGQQLEQRSIFNRATSKRAITQPRRQILQQC